ncbi:MAG: hypothetical protein ACYSW3_00275 [Planctomycetota bacterium]|jgi:hypothetical protein
MSGDENATINSDTGGSSSPTTSTGDLVPTVELGIKTPGEGGEGASSAPDDKTGEGGKDGVPADQATGKGDGDADPTDAAKGKTTDDRFDQHPRFIELNNRVKAAEAVNATLRQEMDAVKQGKPGEPKEGDTKLPFKDTSGMPEEELLEWMQKDPKGYHANMEAAMEHRLTEKFTKHMEKQSFESQVDTTFTSFAKENPEFDAMWDRGELQRYMDQNPGHNAISAYQMLTQEARMKEATEKAVADAEKTWNANLKAARESKVLSAGPSSAGAGAADKIPAELQDTKKHGGLTSVLANRSKQRTG